MELVTVYETTRQDMFALAKSILSSTDIDYVTEGEGYGFFGFNTITGTMKIKVNPEDKESAQEILKDIES